VGVGELQPDVPAGDAALELLGAALGDDPAQVADRDPVGEMIRGSPMSVMARSNRRRMPPE